MCIYIYIMCIYILCVYIYILCIYILCVYIYIHIHTYIYTTFGSQVEPQTSHLHPTAQQLCDFGPQSALCNHNLLLGQGLEGPAWCSGNQTGR